MVEDSEHRRHNDRTLELLEEKIVSLIENTEDNKDKAYLLILMKLNDSLATNTTNISKITDRLSKIVSTVDSHVKITEAYINRGKGWKDTLVWTLGAIQALGVWALISLNTQLKDIHHEQLTQKIEIVKHISSDISTAHKKE